MSYEQLVQSPEVLRCWCPGARSAPSRRSRSTFCGGSTTKHVVNPRMMAQISNRYFCRMGCNRGMSESCSCTLQMKTGASPYTWPGCSSVFGGPSLFLPFVHKDSLWRRVLNSWFQIQDPSHLSSTCKVPSIGSWCQDYMALGGGACVELLRTRLLRS
jgi:hypothetical protein